MADQSRPTDSDPPATTAAEGFNPTPVNIGGASLADRVLPHLKTILLVVGVGTVVVTGFYTWRWWQHRSAEKKPGS